MSMESATLPLLCITLLLYSLQSITFVIFIVKRSASLADLPLLLLVLGALAWGAGFPTFKLVGVDPTSTVHCTLLTVWVQFVFGKMLVYVAFLIRLQALQSSSQKLQQVELLIAAGTAFSLGVYASIDPKNTVFLTADAECAMDFAFWTAQAVVQLLGQVRVMALVWQIRDRPTDFWPAAVYAVVLLAVCVLDGLCQLHPALSPPWLWLIVVVGANLMVANVYFWIVLRQGWLNRRVCNEETDLPISSGGRGDGYNGYSDPTCAPTPAMAQWHSQMAAHQKKILAAPMDERQMKTLSLSFAKLTKPDDALGFN